MNNSLTPKGKGGVLRESGSVTIEFAFLFPLFLLLVFAAYELGIFLYNKQVITNAAREAARVGIVMQNPRTNETQIENQVVTATQGILVGVDLDCPEPGTDCNGVTVTNVGGNSGQPLTVAVTIQFPFPFLSAFSDFLGSIPITGQSTMVLE